MNNVKDRIYKLERMLYFVETFKNNAHQFKLTECRGRKEYKITDQIYMSYLPYDEMSSNLMYIEKDDIGVRGRDGSHVLKTYPHGIEHMDDFLNLPTSYYEKNKAFSFLFFTTEKNSLDVDVFNIDNSTIEIEIPEYDLMNEDGQFQYSLLHSDEFLGIMQTVQYFYNKNHHAYADWYHKDFDKIYEVLDGLFGIGREDYIFSK